MRHGYTYKPVWELYSDWGKCTGDFHFICLEVNTESHYFTFHIALLGFHFGRSLAIRL